MPTNAIVDYLQVFGSFHVEASHVTNSTRYLQLFSQKNKFSNRMRLFAHITYFENVIVLFAL